MSLLAGASTGNRLLAALSRAESKRLEARMELVLPAFKEVLYHQGDPMEYVYFPHGGVFSVVIEMDGQKTVEIATVGSEGIIGVPALLGADRSPVKVFAQIPGEALRMQTAPFLKEVRRGGPLQAVLHRYTQAFMSQIAQSVVCNRLHVVEARCARWLLTTHDRAGADEFPLTQEFLAAMLGVRRATVSGVARALQRQGWIRYRRGKMQIIDREGLEKAACDCYRIVKQDFDRMVGAPRG